MKRIVICADGTWNQQDQVDQDTGKRRPTNVTKVARTVLPSAADGVAQVVFYHDGVGTGGGLDKFSGGAFGDGICVNVVELYRCILYNYVPGDELYLFGFSRGAFTVRTLAGFMNQAGLLHKDGDYYVPDFFDLYQQRQGSDSDAWKQLSQKVKTGHPCPDITYIGVWDTVGALGAPGFLGRYVNGGKYQFHDVGLNPHIRNTRHALAIDEHRVPFEPTLWTRPQGWTGSLEQAWFAGVHSNVGGSYKPDGLANEALHWLVEKAEQLGLEFDKAALAYYTPCFNSVMKDSMTTLYRVMGQLFRPIGQHLGDGEAVHQSVLDRWNHDPSYRPKNLADQMNGAVCKLPVVNTQRIPRGTPCADLKP